MTAPDWTVTVHGRTHRITDAEYRHLLAMLDIADRQHPVRYVANFSGEEITFPYDWRSSVTFTRSDS